MASNVTCASCQKQIDESYITLGCGHALNEACLISSNSCPDEKCHKANRKVKYEQKYRTFLQEQLIYLAFGFLKHSEQRTNFVNATFSIKRISDKTPLIFFDERIKSGVDYLMSRDGESDISEWRIRDKQLYSHLNGGEKLTDAFFQGFKVLVGNIGDFLLPPEVFNLEKLQQDFFNWNLTTFLRDL